MLRLSSAAVVSLATLTVGAVQAQSPTPRPIPQITRQDGHASLLVDGQPFLMLGAQINNSSSWPSALPHVWPALEQMHVNTVEAPVYWEQLEPQPGHFDFSGVDLLVHGAREHGLRLVLLWFGTWKNGQAHYVPEWIKTDTKRFPREVTNRGNLLDVLSPNSTANRDADAHAFAALMRHLREIDQADRTVLMIQVENESGSIGSVRDFSPAANREFAGPVPPALIQKLGKPAGTWATVFGADADERFAAFSTASYIDTVARAGKAEYPLPMYCNVWITYPVHALEHRDHPSPGQEYPSGGPQQGNIDLWKAAAPSIDVLAPDFYSGDFKLLEQVVREYRRPDNPLFIPETGRGPGFGRDLFYALGQGAIGFSAFGVDFTGWSMGDESEGGSAAEKTVLPSSLAEDVPLLRPLAPQIAALNLQGGLQTAVEQPGLTRTRLHFGDIDAVVSFGFPQRDGESAPGTKTEQDGRALVGQIPTPPGSQPGGADFLVTGLNASIRFELAPNLSDKPATQLEILSAEEGEFSAVASTGPPLSAAWRTARVWNGDQTDRGLNFPAHNRSVIRIHLHRLPLTTPSR
jgi:hypothetical protein